MGHILTSCVGAYSPIPSIGDLFLARTPGYHSPLSHKSPDLFKCILVDHSQAASSSTKLRRSFRFKDEMIYLGYSAYTDLAYRCSSLALATFKGFCPRLSPGCYVDNEG
jgi:hypothetical protein